MNIKIPQSYLMLMLHFTLLWSILSCLIDWQSAVQSKAMCYSIEVNCIIKANVKLISGYIRLMT